LPAGSNKTAPVASDVTAEIARRRIRMAVHEELRGSAKKIDGRRKY
jgi:hypothetical protein